MPRAFPNANSWNQITSSLISFLFNKDKKLLSSHILGSYIFLGNKMGKPPKLFSYLPCHSSLQPQDSLIISNQSVTLLYVCYYNRYPYYTGGLLTWSAVMWIKTI